jgi:hypothetical protein
MKWTVAITTAPRKECTLNACIASLLNCGFASYELNIFAEPESTLPTHGNLHLSPQKLGVWRNWVHSVQHSIANTDADLILTVQDDSLFHPDSKDFIESALWPSADCGFISLYTPKHYTVRKDRTLRDPGINRIITHSLWGACALVWPREILEKIVLPHPLIHKWYGAQPRSGSPSVIERRKADPSLIANSDTAIGKMMNWTKRSMWFVDPSPVQHIARYSTISHGDNSGRRNAFRIADHSLPLSAQVPIPQRHRISV